MRPLELWAGHECSVIRTGDGFADQTVMSGHEYRLSDIERFAKLGAKALRYPVLWERVAPDRPEERDFSWSDERLEAMRRLGIRPIVGLLHHGSGPRYTSMLDPGFPQGLAAYARAVAERYPWVEDWSPVNEPLTTARFSCLYGVWYPHRQGDHAAFWRALLNEVTGVVLAMRAIREVNPNARLIQTDDLGFSHATHDMAEQATFENERRWITWDLLFGRVIPGHPLWAYIAAFGLHRPLEELAAAPCPPDIIGVNYYAGSERLLDHRLHLYPPGSSGGDGAHDGAGAYVNVDAAHHLARGLIGLEGLLDQAWKRYGQTLAVTESHNVGTRDESMRWLLEIWNACETVRRDGVEVASVTAWTLLGAFDWKTLGVAGTRRYETGVFDLSGGEPRETAIVPLLQALAAGREPPANVALASPGWWRRDVRFSHELADERVVRETEVVEAGPVRLQSAPVIVASRPILVIGRTGTLGQVFARACERRGLPVVATDRTRLRLEAAATIAATLEEVEPCAVVNAAGFASLNGAETHPELCRNANAIGPGNLARACKQRNLPLITFSSDMVFDGTHGAPYTETDEPRPVNAYGRSKAEGERQVLAAGGRVLIIRTATFFSPYEANNFAVRLLNDLAAGRNPAFAENRFMSPTYVPDLVDAALDLLIDGETGIWHLTNQGRISWAGFARMLAEVAGYDPGSVRGMPAERLGWRATIGEDLSLASSRGSLLAEIEPTVRRFVSDTRHAAVKVRPQAGPDERDPIVTLMAG